MESHVNALWYWSFTKHVREANLILLKWLKLSFIVGECLITCLFWKAGHNRSELGKENSFVYMEVIVDLEKQTPC